MILKNYILLNSPGEYASTFDNPYTILWILSATVSSCYAYTWDIKMDWGLFDSNANENTFLREEIVYSSTVSLLFTPQTNHAPHSFKRNISSKVVLLFRHHRGFRTSFSVDRHVWAD